MEGTYEQNANRKNP